MCLLLVALLPYVCSALCFCWATLFAIAPGSCLVWCLYSHIASSSHVVRIIIIYVLLFEFSFCTFTCSSCFSACEHIFFCFLFVVCNFAVFLFCVVFQLNMYCLSLFSSLSIWCLSFHVANNHVVRIIIISVVLFEFSHCTAQLRNRSVWWFAFGYYVCMLLRIKYVLVVSCLFAVFLFRGVVILPSC